MNISDFNVISDILRELQQEYDETQKQMDKFQLQIDRLKKLVMEREAYHVDQNIVCQNLSIMNIQEEDRQRIARDLHDTSLQNLAHIVHKIELSSLFIDQDPVKAKIELSVVIQNLRDVIDEIRNTIFDLRPMTFDDLGLKPALERFLEVINENQKYHIDAKLDDVSCENKLVLVSIYRVIQECFVNITKHAKADKIIFHCTQEDDVCKIRIEDDGVGFSYDELNQRCGKHFGVGVMKERVILLGGKITVDSKKDIGTKIDIEIPLGLCPPENTERKFG